MQTSFYSNHNIHKSELKRLLQWSLKNHGFVYTCNLSARLKLLGFQYATQSGLSIGLGDLQTSPSKSLLVEGVHEEIYTNSVLTERQWISLIDRAAFLRTRWTKTSEILKNLSLTYFQKTQGLNPVFLMCTSGARGNVSQIRQLVAMRGLMADSSGNVLELPIRSNFREGLTLAEYFISCYGARKGVVDTALGTAKSGYLTRRLSYVVHDMTIAELDCQTYRAKRLNSSSNSIGYTLARSVLRWDTFEPIVVRNTVVTPKLQTRLRGVHTISLSNTGYSSFFVRSPLCCEAFAGICQLCYGWSLAQKGMVGLGESIGILAAQSIGEPSTQLTMRTFHTGGVFDSKQVTPILSRHNGRVGILKHARLVKTRTIDGSWALFTSQSTFCLIADPTTNRLSCFFIPTGFFLFVLPGQHVEHPALLAQQSTYSFGNRPRLNRHLYKLQITESISSQLQTLYGSYTGLLKYDVVMVDLFTPQSLHPDLDRIYSYFARIQSAGFIWVVLCDVCPSSYLKAEFDLCLVDGHSKTILLHNFSPNVSLSLPRKPSLRSLVPLFFKYNPLTQLHISRSAKQRSFSMSARRGLRYFSKYRSRKVTLVHLFPSTLSRWTTPRRSSPMLFVPTPNQSQKASSQLVRESFSASRLSTLFSVDSQAHGASQCLHVPFFGLTMYREQSALLSRTVFPAYFECKHSYSGLRGFTRAGQPCTLHPSTTTHLLYIMNRSTLSTRHTSTSRLISQSNSSRFRNADPFLTVRSQKKFVRYQQKLSTGVYWTYHSNHVRLSHESLPLYVLPDTYMRQFDGMILFEHISLYTWFASTLKTGDIIQGLPQIEKRFEGRADFQGLFESLFMYLWRKQLSLQKCALSSDHFQGHLKRDLEEYLLVDQIQHIYISQGINIEQKHLEVIVRQLYLNCFILDGADSGLLPGDIVRRSVIESLHTYFQCYIRWTSLFFGLSKNVLQANPHHFLTVSTFQRTQAKLRTAAFNQTPDFLLGLKQNIMFGHLLPIGSSAL